MRPWGKLCAAYPRFEASAATAAIYHERLRKFDVERILVGVNAAIDKCKFFPTIAEIIENIAAIPTDSTKWLDAPKPTKEEAKAIVEMLAEHIKRFETKDLATTEKRIAERKEFLRKQAQFLGVK